MFVTLFSSCVFSCVLIYCYIYSDNYIHKYKRFKKVYNFVSIHHKGYINIIYISMLTIFSAKCHELYRSFNNSAVKMSNNKYLVTYTINNKTYKMIVHNSKGPKKVINITDETNENIYNDIIEYLGPQENFHNISYTPKDFGKKQIIFELYTEKKIIFNENDIMTLLHDSNNKNEI